MRRSRPSTYSRAALLRAALVAVMCACLGAAATSCFKTREAEPPTTVGNAPVLPLTVWDVLYNMKLAVDSQDPITYEDIFAEDFMFKPDPADSIEVEKNFPGAYADWDKRIETGVMGYVLDPVRCKYANLQFASSAEVIVDFTDTTYILQEDYSLILKLEAFEGYAGRSRFFFRKGPDGYWRIERWVDYINDNQDPTWGRLKGETRARM
jgi:hypothetical protein